MVIVPETLGVIEAKLPAIDRGGVRVSDAAKVGDPDLEMLAKHTAMPTTDGRPLGV